jgi:hypothetical protein
MFLPISDNAAGVMFQYISRSTGYVWAYAECSEAGYRFLIRESVMKKYRPS